MYADEGAPNPYDTSHGGERRGLDQPPVFRPSPSVVCCVLLISKGATLGRRQGLWGPPEGGYAPK